MSSGSSGSSDKKDPWEEAIRISASRVYRPVPVAPAIMRARARGATAAAQAQLGPLMDAIMTAPFFLCSTHGIYDLSDTSRPCTVPRNTYIFEAQTVGDLALTTIDEHIWTLLQGPNREAFFQYLTGDKTWFTESGQAMDPDVAKAVSNLVLYTPGSTYYRRTLEIGGGRSSSGSESQRRVYEDMAFYRFDPGTPSYEFEGYGRRSGYNPHKPYEILHGLRSQLVMDGNLATTDCDLVDCISLTNRKAPTFLNGTPINQDFRTAWPAGYDSNWPAIFVFSSCAAVTKAETPKENERWEKIARLQQENIQSAWSMGFNGIFLGSASGSMPPKPRSVVLRSKGKPIPESFVEESKEERFSRENENLQPVMGKFFGSSSSSSSTKKRKNRRKQRKSRRRRSTRK